MEEVQALDVEEKVVESDSNSTPSIFDRMVQVKRTEFFVDTVEDENTCEDVSDSADVIGSDVDHQYPSDMIDEFYGASVEDVDEDAADIHIITEEALTEAEEVSEIEVSEQTPEIVVEEDVFDDDEETEIFEVAVAEPEAIEEVQAEESFIEETIEAEPEIVEAFVEAVEEDPMEAEVPETEIFKQDDSAESFVEAEDDVSEEFIDAIEESVIEEAAVEEPAVMSLPKVVMEETEEIVGLNLESNQESSDSVVEASIESTEVIEAVPTGASAVVEQPAAISVDGEALPPLSDPVVRRPRTVRFRFSNGVLQNVDSAEKVEPREELRDPLA